MAKIYFLNHMHKHFFVGLLVHNRIEGATQEAAAQNCVHNHNVLPMLKTEHNILIFKQFL